METGNEAIIGFWGAAFIGLYLVSLIWIGQRGRAARRENSMADFYLGGRGLTVWVLFLTLYATQYSGNTLIGFSGSAYREGYRFLMSFTFMTCVVGAYLIYAPKLFTASRSKGYITPSDYAQDRFNSRLLTGLVTLICIVTLANYILTNLKGMGHVVRVISGGRIGFVEGIVLLSVIMVVYESLGGMRSVAWTDALQGVLLLFGCSIVLFATLNYAGGLSAVADYLKSERLDLWKPPDWRQKISWLSTLILVFFGISLYPHAIQRIYAARDACALRRSLQIMAFMPIFTTFFMILVGIVGIQQFPGLTRDRSEEISFMILGRILEQSPAMEVVAVVFLAAAVAAIMSTVDSALLTASSIFTQDVYRLRFPESSQAHLTRVGKILSWLLMAAMAVLASTLPQTIWALVQIKLELLCQIAPVFFLGLHIPNLRAREMVWGLLSGIAITLFFLLGPQLGLPISSMPFGVHAGVIGFGVNLSVIGIVYCLRNRKG